MLNLGKKQVKMVSLAIATFFLLGVAGLALSQAGRTSIASAASSSSNVGVVNYQLLMQQSPDLPQAQQDMQAAVDQAKKDFESKSATMSDKEKQDYQNQLQQGLQVKNQQIKDALMKKIDDVIKTVSEAKGLSVVMDKANVVYGGQDITDDVGKKLTGK
jgi:outer membrane protein